MNCPAPSLAEPDIVAVPTGTLDRLASMLTARLISEQAARQPGALALAAGAKRLTYAELDTRAAQLANYLRSRGVGPESLVGLCLERSPEFVVAALAIMKCGAAYLPMDPANPAERLRFVLQDAGVRHLLTVGKFSGQFGGLEVIALDAEEDNISRQPTESPALDDTNDPLAYVIYTSGSTGQPKGVEITQRNLSNLVAWHVRAFALDASTRATFQAGVGFDAAVWEIWPALTAGAALLIPDETTRLEAKALCDWLVAERITISFVPTALAEQLIALPWPAETSLRFLLTGADTLQRFPATGLPFTFVNNYGPTECTVVTTSAVISPQRKGNNLPSIGAPIDHVQVHILDDELRQIADGVIGEICVGGAGVARGYRNRPEQTAASFVADPFRPHGGRLYKTGDCGRRLANGEIEFLGRRDDQVKIRGYRVELSEINTVLNEHPSVRASVVTAREDAPGEKRLVAYIVAPAGSARNEQSLREAVRKRLPDYMEPSAFVWLEALPLTPNGKVDRAALPAPTVEEQARAGEFIAPRTPVEETLASIITEVLKLPRVSVHDDFFQLGAHSLLGAQIIARVRSVFGAELKLLDVFDAPTVAELSLRIEDALTRQLNAMSDAEVAAALADSHRS